MSSIRVILSVGLLSAAQLVAGHGAIINAVGDAGGSGMALGVDTTTPRDGTRRRPFQQDSTRFRGDQADSVGETLAGGDNNIEQGAQAIMAETGDQLPQITQGGELTMTLHQVNADGGGPYTCEINADGTGQTWESITVTTTPPGEDSRNRDGAASDFPLVAAIPADQACTGTVAGQDNACLVRCMNAANAGPFGGVIPVQMAGAANGGATKARRALANAIKREAMSQRKTKRQADSYDEEEEEEEDCE
ncbi:putative mas3 protein [Rosellinia necatrix]|uniref:Putative mas3 protein n=1 Tax=Rosellinia necatrix TaxID=77044 RepID=A0A1W2TJZ5_ROSNE|nr:putative mas3 protein [Rosellinia necatrix]